MTRVAAGWPTTFCDSTAVRSATGSDGGFFARLGAPFFSFSTPPSDLIIAAEWVRTRFLRRCSGGFGSFMGGLINHLNEQFNNRREAVQNISCKPVTRPPAYACITPEHRSCVRPDT